ncbi:hypothetical protein BC832DRAFT_418551 [Gaertneriomyces semiglobifer]|nr:hypothetical protein BC832DRAFT_418551 [Gaertneriomyces semiglobifer]
MDTCTLKTQCNRPTLRSLVRVQLGTQALTHEKDVVKARRYFQRASEEGCVLALALCAFFREFGLEKGISDTASLKPVIEREDYQEAERLYMTAAAQGCGVAQARLAFLKTHGRPGIVIDLSVAEQMRKLCAAQGATAIRWLQLVASSGLASAQFCLALCYYNGIAVPENDVEAFHWCVKAADQGHAGAQNVLGNLYTEGSGCAKDPVQGLRWYIRGAEQREAAAIYNIGTLFERGVAVAHDERQAFGWYLRAARYGSINAQNVIGIFYEQGIAGTDENGDLSQNPTRAADHYRIAAESGHPHAQYNLARCHHDGFGVLKSNILALEWFQRAALQGHALSQFSMAICLERGIGTIQDVEKAKEQYWRAAENEIAEAAKRLATYTVLEYLTPARVLLFARARTAASKTCTPSLAGIWSLPPELIDYILTFLNPRQIVPPNVARSLRQIAGDRRTLSTNRLRSKDHLLRVLGMEAFAIHNGDCECAPGQCSRISHVVETLDGDWAPIRTVEEVAAELKEEERDIRPMESDSPLMIDTYDALVVEDPEALTPTIASAAEPWSHQSFYSSYNSSSPSSSTNASTSIMASPISPAPYPFPKGSSGNR